jgi:Secretion system C-terminal sorting domain
MKPLITLSLFWALTTSVCAQHWYAQDNQFLYTQKWFGKQLPQHITGFRTAIVQRWHPVNNVWINTLRHANQYVGASAVPQTTVIDAWNEASNTWKQNSIVNYNFANNLFQNQVIQTANAAGVYTSYSKETHNWSANNQLKEVVTQGWNTSNSTWVNAYRDTNVYQNNKLFLIYKQQWAIAPFLVFYDDARDSLTYDNNGRLAVNYQQSLAGTRFLTAQRDVNTYDATGNRVELRREFVNDITINSYDTIFRWTFTYNTQNNPTVLLRQQWNKGAKLWQNHTRVTNTYNANGKITQEVVEIPNGTAWTNVTRTLYDELTDTKELINNDAVVIYPNPTAQNSYLELKDKTLMVHKINVFNSVGQLVNTINVAPNVVSIYLESKDLVRGVYLLHIETTKGKIIKEWMKL